jgi:hypothetical protein
LFAKAWTSWGMRYTPPKRVASSGFVVRHMRPGASSPQQQHQDEPFFTFQHWDAVRRHLRTLRGIGAVVQFGPGHHVLAGSDGPSDHPDQFISGPDFVIFEGDFQASLSGPGSTVELPCSLFLSCHTVFSRLALTGDHVDLRLLGEGLGLVVEDCELRGVTLQTYT